MDRRALTLRQGPIDERQYRSALSQNIAVESTSTSYLSPSTASADSLNKEFKLHIGRFFYENGLDFGAVSSSELNGWIFRDVMKRVDEIKRSWAVTGCSILLDGWTYANDQTFVNVLVDSPKGTVYLSSSDITDCVGNMEAMQTFLARVLAEVGLHNVVQIVTYSSSAFMMEAGRQLMERYRPIFWTTLEKAKIISSFVHNHPIALKYVQDQTNGSGLVDSSRPFLMVENIVIKKGG
ncbi:uncharacterized protein LOC125209338 [Salvia hispanica]|uniref:uncharacterized protein LOC125209338 n=1 Tax=Salvia hispanica TaxID=49212 RepID=UPI002009BCEA|nr:uncharacterized protein LOC125209338 [Salvia hispanica]